MIVTFVHVWVKPDHIDDFKQASMENHLASLREEGNLRFDILQDADEPTKFVLYEAYESEQAAKAHKKTEHYAEWKEKVADWMAQPREGKKHLIVAPTDPMLW